MNSPVLNLWTNVLINKLDTRKECTLNMFATILNQEDTKLGRAVDSLRGKEVLQRDLDNLVGYHKLYEI